jgi:hypothetical protein
VSLVVFAVLKVCPESRVGKVSIGCKSQSAHLGRDVMDLVGRIFAGHKTFGKPGNS